MTTFVLCQLVSTDTGHSNLMSGGYMRWFLMKRQLYMVNIYLVNSWHPTASVGCFYERLARQPLSAWGVDLSGPRIPEPTRLFLSPWAPLRPPALFQ